MGFLSWLSWSDETSAITPPPPPKGKNEYDGSYTSNAPVTLTRAAKYTKKWRTDGVGNFFSDMWNDFKNWGDGVLGRPLNAISGAVSGVFAGARRIIVGAWEGIKAVTKFAGGILLGVCSAVAGLAGFDFTYGDIKSVLNGPNRWSTLKSILTQRGKEWAERGWWNLARIPFPNPFSLLRAPFALLAGLGAGARTAAPNLLESGKNLGSGVIMAVPIYGLVRGWGLGAKYGTIWPPTVYRIMRESIITSEGGTDLSKAERIGFQRTHDAPWPLTKDFVLKDFLFDIPRSSPATSNPTTAVPAVNTTAANIAAANAATAYPASAAATATATNFSNAAGSYASAGANVQHGGNVTTPSYATAGQTMTGQGLSVPQANNVVQGVQYTTVRNDGVINFTGNDQQAGAAAREVKTRADTVGTPVDIVLTAVSMEAAVRKMAAMDPEVLKTLDQVEIGAPGVPKQILTKGDSGFTDFCESVNARQRQLQPAIPAAPALNSPQSPAGPGSP